MATSTKRAYATPRSAAPRAPAPWQATADPYLHRRHSSTVLAQSLWPFHFKGLECKSRKSRHTWSNRQIRPWSTKQSRSKANRVLPRACTGHSKHPLPTTQETILHMDITRWSTGKSDYVLCSKRWRSSIQSVKTRLGADCGLDHELLIANFRIKLKTVGKTTRPFRYDLNQIPYGNYTVEVTSEFKGLDLEVESLKNYGWRFATLFRRQ